MAGYDNNIMLKALNSPYTKITDSFGLKSSYAFFLSSSSNSYIGGVYSHMSNYSGIRVSNSDNVIVTNSTLSKQLIGLRSTYNNGFFNNNNFINNSEQAEDCPTVNNWDYLRKGNFWNDFDCNDTDSNNICDEPYIVDDT